MDWRAYIQRNPEILLGKPTFIGTRISVEMVLDEMAAGASDEEIVTAHPSLRREHLRAATAFAAASLRMDEVVFLEPEPIK
jgi:uncharacterized protein (DUF433 family)